MSRIVKSRLNFLTRLPLDRRAIEGWSDFISKLSVLIKAMKYSYASIISPSHTVINHLSLPMSSSPPQSCLCTNSKPAHWCLWLRITYMPWECFENIICFLCRHLIHARARRQRGNTAQPSFSISHDHWAGQSTEPEWYSGHTNKHCLPVLLEVPSQDAGIWLKKGQRRVFIAKTGYCVRAIECL